jgi:hypothetical protein
VVDQDPPHGLGRDPNVVTARLEGVATDQPEVSLMHQRRGGTGVVGRLAVHPQAGKPPQLVVNELKQLGRGPLVTPPGGIEEIREIRHECPV